MAPNATIFKAVLHIADVDRRYYQDHTVTLARHPSETDERMMVRAGAPGSSRARTAPGSAVEPTQARVSSWTRASTRERRR